MREIASENAWSRRNDLGGHHGHLVHSTDLERYAVAHRLFYYMYQMQGTSVPTVYVVRSLKIVTWHMARNWQVFASETLTIVGILSLFIRH